MRRPRAFARERGSIAAEHAGPRGRTVLLQSTVDGQEFSGVHRSQTVYRGRACYPDLDYPEEPASADDPFEEASRNGEGS